MNKFREVLRRYLLDPYEDHYGYVRPERRQEVEGAIDDLEACIDKRIKAAIEAHTEADDEMGRHLSQWHDCDYDD